MKEADNCETSSIGQVEGVYRDICKLVGTSKVIMMIKVMVMSSGRSFKDVEMLCSWELGR